VEPTQDLLRAYLAEHEEPCPRCGYNLHALTGARCPECGDELTLLIGLAEPRMGPYMATVMAACAGAGASGFMIMLAAVYAPGSWWRDSAAGWILLVEFAVALPAAVLLLRRRRLFTRLPYERQKRLALLATAVTVILCLLVIATFEG
jgi:hypothetical protein